MPGPAPNTEDQMIFKHKGRKVEVEVSGSPDEPRIDSGYYLDGEEESLTSADLDDILSSEGCTIADGLRDREIDRQYDLANDR